MFGNFLVYATCIYLILQKNVKKPLFSACTLILLNHESALNLAL